MDAISLYLCLIPSLPLAACVVCAAFGPRLLRRFSHVPVIAAVVASCLCSLLLLQEVRRAQEVPRGGDAVRTDRAPFERVVRLWVWADVQDAYRHPGGASPSAPGGGWRDFRIEVALRADALTAMMLAMVTLVSSLIVIYSAGYMRGDRGYWRFFAYLGLFVFSMTMLVSVSNFVLLYVFWEAVGVCSYLLIGFWYQKPEAAEAGKKAFLVNRVGDLGFALALFLIWTVYGTLDFHDTAAGEVARGGIPSAVATSSATGVGEGGPRGVAGVLGKSRIAANEYVGGKVGLAICLLLLLGACGKSAQFPLHVWLPDAMEGPTPVSALIHAATMVTAGVYMIARCTPLFMVSPQAQLVVACVGGLTALMAALIALTQFDLKRVLAYSTISQLGYMFLGLGAGTFAGITAGLFHLFTHAFFKALLFLGAGSVMHAMRNVIDMRRLGGLRRLLPVTHATFLVGCLALAGVPPLSGFWSKDAIVAAVEAQGHIAAGHPEHSSSSMDHRPEEAGSNRGAHAAIYRWLYWVSLVTAFCTAFYSFRAFCLTFYGKEQVPHEAGGHAHESPPVMAWPLVILALGAALAGICLDRTYAAGTPTHLFAEFLAGTPSLAGGPVAATKGAYAFHGSVAAVSSAVAVAGLFLAVVLYRGERRGARRLQSLLDLEGFSRWFNAQTPLRWAQRPWIAAVHRGACRWGLGWLTSAIGYVVFIAGLVIASPLLLSNFLSPYKLSQRKFFLDEAYQWTVVAPLRLLASACYVVDRWVVDGLVDLVGRIPLGLGFFMRSLQMGLVQFYALAMFLGVLVLMAARLLVAGP